MNFLLKTYRAAFQACYPGKKLEFARRGANHYVIIDGDKGESPLNDAELKFAIENFNRGRIGK